MPKNWSRVWRQILMALPWIDVAACQNMELISKILFSSHACIAPQSLASIRESLGKIQLQCLQIDIIPSAFQKKSGIRNGNLPREVKLTQTSSGTKLQPAGTPKKSPDLFRLLP
ncbi:hypothetical protein AVEN_39459-1 [Araneus ventricosus]|uniref:Uncharacterized protein n=1 Tax=Araneus ventricosus TaxID=182803 RepID=A0A4Y2D788_ARAVE|nr:hypothetical protein AVEN_39459-1 [Araneus ventricosus]